MMHTVTIMVRPEGAADAQATAARGSRLQYFIERHHMWYVCPYLTLPAEQEAVLVDAEDTLCQTMKGLGPASTNANVMFNLRKVGRTLFTRLLPASLQDHLKDVARAAKAEAAEAATAAAAAAAGAAAAAATAVPATPVLRIHTNINWVPWELMYDDDTDFLGVSFQMARLPTNRIFSPAEPEIQSHEVASVVSLLGNNLLDNNNELNLWATTFTDANVAPLSEFRRPTLNGNPPDYPSIGTLDGQPLRPDILHVTCHGDIQRGSKVTWTLDHRSNDTLSYDIDGSAIAELAALLGFGQQRPLVFGNACASATGPGSNPDRPPADFGARFMELGAAAFVGTFAPISKSLAVDVARQFYRRLLVDGQPIGEALRATKEHYRNPPGGNPPGPDPSWLFYALYGPPELRFSLAS